MNPFVYPFGSGLAFFPGILLVVLAALWGGRLSRPWADRLRLLAGIVGLIVIAVSTTPLPWWFYAPVGIASIVWLVAERRKPLTPSGIVRRCRAIVAIGWLAGAALEFPYHLSTRAPLRPNTPVYVIGDSLSAGAGEDRETTWPARLSRDRVVEVRNLAMAGTTVRLAAEQARRITDERALVLIEIGGIDVLNATAVGLNPAGFEAALDDLLTLAGGPDRTLVMVELPLPPGFHLYGAAQRRLAKRHGATLIPKRVLMGVLVASNSTIDTLHLSPQGHQRMADAVWEFISPQ